MSEDSMLKCLIAFILGWLASRMMGNGFSVGGEDIISKCKDNVEVPGNIPGEKFTIDFCSKWCKI